jgi:high-affinity Fe2+/Pb2+ permease
VHFLCRFDWGDIVILKNFLRRAFMFNNIGKKIKKLAQFGCWVGIICCIITGIVFLVLTSVKLIFILPGLLVLILGPILMWIGSWYLYSWGDTVDNVQMLKEKLCGKSDADNSKKQEKEKQKLEELLASGLISHEEYLKALEKEGLC